MTRPKARVTDRMGSYITPSGETVRLRPYDIGKFVRDYLEQPREADEDNPQGLPAVICMLEAAVQFSLRGSKGDSAYWKELMDRAYGRVPLPIMMVDVARVLEEKRKALQIPEEWINADPILRELMAPIEEEAEAESLNIVPVIIPSISLKVQDDS